MFEVGFTEILFLGIALDILENKQAYAVVVSFLLWCLSSHLIFSLWLLRVALIIYTKLGYCLHVCLCTIQAIYENLTALSKLNDNAEDV